MIFETDRLVLRPWSEEDAESLYELAKDPLVGPIAGWPVHTSVENSRQIIKDILSAEGTYAITLKGDDKAIGSIGLMVGEKSNLTISDHEAEIGYWIGVPFWGKGYVPEAVNKLIHYAFEERNISTLWCGYFEGNEKSKRVQEKCGFIYHHTEEEKYWPAINDYRTEHISKITREQWEGKK
jgi:RimJ/RimL family protein N-acetyltransferase